MSWPSKALHDVAMVKFMKDPSITGMMMDELPFDGKRMIYEGFRWLLMNNLPLHFKALL